MSNEKQTAEQVHVVTTGDVLESGALVTRSPGVMAPLQQDRPDFLPTGDVRGTEHVTKDDIKMPRIALAQGLSPQIEEGRAEFIEGLRLGQMFNTLTRQNYGKGPLEFTIIRADPPRFVQFRPRSEGGGVIDIDVPANDPRTQFTKDQETGESVPPLATKFYDFIILLLPSMELVALSFKSTGLKVAQTLNGLMKLRSAPSFIGKYTLTANMDKNAKGTFAAYQVKNSETLDEFTSKRGWVSEQTYKYAEQLHEALKTKVITIDRDDVPETGTDFAYGENTPGGM